MKLFPAIPVISLTVLLFSCNSNPAKEEETKTSDTTTTTTAAAEPTVEKPAFTPFKVVMLQHKVKDFEKSRAGYFSRDSIRSAYGLTHYLMGRDLKDTNTVFIVDKIEDEQKAKSFYTHDKVKEVMKNAGVSRAPGYTYAEIIRSAESAPDTGVQLSVAYRVKNFDDWLKAFDAQGASSRAANGLTDRGLGRNLDDPNSVATMFAVSDMAKAKAYLASPEFKKFLTDNGVDGPPTTRWFRLVE